MKWIVVGSGVIAYKFMTAFNECKAILDNNEVVGVLNRNKKSASIFARKFGIPVVYTSVEDINAEYDAVYLGTPNVLHYSMTKDFITRGVNVLCEKPLTDSHTKAQELFDLALDKEVRLLEAFMHINNPLYQKHIGSVNTLEANYSTLMDDIKNGVVESSNDSILKRSMMGGAISDVGVYPISLGIFLNGDVTKWTIKVLKYKRDVETEVRLKMRHVGGSTTVSDFTLEAEWPDKDAVKINDETVCSSLTFRHLRESRMKYEILNLASERDLTHFTNTSIETARLLELMRNEAADQVDSMTEKGE